MALGKLLSPGRTSRGSIKKSRIQEKVTAKELDGSVVPASGSQWHSKGDVLSKKWLVECKTTAAKQYQVKLVDWVKVEAQALSQKKLPVLQVEIGTKRLAVVDWDVFLEVSGHGD